MLSLLFTVRPISDDTSNKYFQVRFSATPLSIAFILLVLLSHQLMCNVPRDHMTMAAKARAWRNEK